MVRLKNITSMDLQVPALGDQVVKAGETVDVDDALVGVREDEHGDLLGNVWPESNWEVQADDDLTVAELREQLKAKGLPTSGTKDELLARLAEADTEGEGE